MTTPKEISATEKLLELIRTSSLPPDLELKERPGAEPDFSSGLTLEEFGHEHDADGYDHDHLHGHEQPPSVETSPPLSPFEPTPVVDSSLPPVHPLPAADINASKTPARESNDKVRLVPPVVEPPPKRTSFFEASRMALSRAMQGVRQTAKTTIAVDIQPGVVHIVKSRNDAQGHTLLSCQSVPYPFDPDAPPKNLYDDLEFKAVLFSALSSIVEARASSEIWCSYAFCNPVGLHNISIPKVGEKEIPNAVFWSTKRELEFDEHSTIFDYSVLQEYTEGTQVKIQTLVTLVPREEVEGVETMFRGAGFPLTGLTFPAAATLNFVGHDTTVAQDNPVVYFTIRKHNSFIDIFHQGKMFFSREIKTGTDSFVESLMEQALSKNILIDEENAKDYLFRPADGSKRSEAVCDEIFALLNFDELSVIDRLVRQLMRTFEYCTTTFKTPPVCKIFTSGECTVNDAILQAIENRVGVPCGVISPLAHHTISPGIPKSVTSASGLLVAAGLSLSDKQTTLNFLFTYAEKFEEAAVNRLNSIIAIATICLAVGSGMFFAVQYKIWLNKKSTLTAMQTELAQKYLAEPRSRSTEYTTQTMQKISLFHSDNKQKVLRYKAVVMIGELAKKIGPEITMIDVVMEVEPKEKEASRVKKDESAFGVVQLKGYITAPTDTQEFILMNFLKSLAAMQTLGEPALISKESTTLQHQDVMQFEITLKTTVGFLEAPAS